MEIRDSQGNIISNPDLELGYLINKVEEITHPAIPGRPAITEMKTIFEDELNPNNKIVQKKIIVPETNAVPAYVEEIPYQEYILYTEDELAEKVAQKEQAEKDRLEQEAEAKKEADFQATLRTIPKRVSDTETQVEDLAVVLVEMIEGA